MVLEQHHSDHILEDIYESIASHSDNITAAAGMGTEENIVVPTERELHAFELNDPATAELIARAQQAVEADRKLTIMEALKKYKTAVFWAMVLSWALVMEGYDIVVVCFRPPRMWSPGRTTLLTFFNRSILSLVRRNSRTASALMMRPPGPN